MTVFGETNYWELNNTIPQYFWLGMGSLAIFTQFLSLFGSANSLNVFVWMYGVGSLGGIVSAVSVVLAYYSYDKAYEMSISPNATSAENTAANSVISDIKSEMAFNWRMSAAIQLAMSIFGRTWWSAQ